MNAGSCCAALGRRSHQPCIFTLLRAFLSTLLCPVSQHAIGAVPKLFASLPRFSGPATTQSSRSLVPSQKTLCAFPQYMVFFPPIRLGCRFSPFGQPVHGFVLSAPRAGARASIIRTPQCLSNLTKILPVFDGSADANLSRFAALTHTTSPLNRFLALCCLTETIPSFLLFQLSSFPRCGFGKISLFHFDRLLRTHPWLFRVRLQRGLKRK